MISFPHVKDGPVFPMLEEMRKEASKHLSLAFREFKPLLSGLPLRYFQVISLRLEETRKKHYLTAAWVSRESCVPWSAPFFSVVWELGRPAKC